MSHLEEGNPSILKTCQVLIRAGLFSDVSITRNTDFILQRILKTELVTPIQKKKSIYSTLK